MDSNNKSEVARLMARIDAEIEASCRGLYGLAYGTTQHEIINAKMERLGQIQEELTETLGLDKAIQMVTEIMEQMEPVKQGEQKGK